MDAAADTLRHQRLRQHSPERFAMIPRPTRLCKAHLYCGGVAPFAHRCGIQDSHIVSIRVSTVEIRAGMGDLASDGVLSSGIVLCNTVPHWVLSSALRNTCSATSNKVSLVTRGIPWTSQPSNHNTLHCPCRAGVDRVDTDSSDGVVRFRVADTRCGGCSVLLR